ncbi:hypothetical protein FHR72_003865 [Mycolicibacterium iranicum]|uniref:Uncharacterized protein n=1 Tax=Mycolicibacterium iranicum TaxID=912594 RepID=A0A839QDV4_MYCIR|nr:hypothetical protein [Mycolicibacterium iranicum]MBB2992366.1 hypothetical protein [Mycolicibacterium iranicum]
MSKDVPGFVTAPALHAVGVGAQILRTPEAVFRVFRFISLNGEILNVAMDRDLVEGVRKTAQDLQIAEIEDDQALYDLGITI